MRILVYTNALVILSHRICYVLARVYIRGEENEKESERERPKNLPEENV